MALRGPERRRERNLIEAGLIEIGGLTALPLSHHRAYAAARSRETPVRTTRPRSIGKCRIGARHSVPPRRLGGGEFNPDYILTFRFNYPLITGLYPSITIPGRLGRKAVCDKVDERTNFCSRMTVRQEDGIDASELDCRLIQIERD